MMWPCLWFFPHGPSYVLLASKRYIACIMHDVDTTQNADAIKQSKI